MKSDRILFLLGLIFHLIGMPLTEYADVRWFYLVLAVEGIWMIYAQVGWKRRNNVGKGKPAPLAGKQKGRVPVPGVRR